MQHFHGRKSVKKYEDYIAQNVQAERVQVHFKDGSWKLDSVSPPLSVVTF